MRALTLQPALNTRSTYGILLREPTRGFPVSGTRVFDLSFLIAYRMFAVALLLFCVVLLWPLGAASRRVKREIEDLAAQGLHDAPEDGS